ncbi:unnamed protein product [Chilo suppressalis]|uniref:Natalisin n=1 Tax=Chilo suppressalis TaxID=168631 RepID=A0ABN8B8H8_CHISP|nr:unnamed protein product [Chilo suppressalis]
MRRKMYIFLLVNLVLSTDLALGSPNNKKIGNKIPQNKHVSKDETKNERSKRALLEEEEHPFWPNRGKKELINSDSENEQFWATRGRRESSEENYMEDKTYTPQKGRLCKNCYPIGNSDAIYGNMKHTRDDTSPFWGMRGRRDSDEVEEDLFWGSRGRRHEVEPFWGNRGRRYEDTPFWGNRGRREEEPFWGNRGRREESPFWGNRGRRENDEPFWGNRGRREEPVVGPGNRVRQEDYEPFWGNRGRRKESESFWSSRGRRKQDLKEAILNAISVVEKDIENLSRLRRNSDDQDTFLDNKSKERRLQHLVNDPLRTHQSFLKTNEDPGTLLDNTMYVEQPHYVVVERSSRSSAEDDPFFISRGKKYFLNFDLEKAVRDRRGAIEEIVKSVRNDPFYIARGKKDAEFDKKGNSTKAMSTLSREEFLKARELICSTIDLIANKNGKNKRNTSLQKLAAQLQMDPYYVSRGKKTDTTNSDSLEDFINEVAAKCN